MKASKKILPTLYDYKRKKYTKMVAYRCDLFKDAGYGKGNTDDTKIHMQTLKNPEGEEIFKEYKNYCVIDDSSKFAAAVYYHYINKEILKDERLENRIAYGIDLWETNSEDFTNKSKIMDILLLKNKFDLIKWDNLEKRIIDNKIELYRNNKRFKLKTGDLVYRKGHVEFYIGKNRVVSWGRVHNTYTIDKLFNEQLNGYYSNDGEDENIPFVTIIRFIGG